MIVIVDVSQGCQPDQSSLLHHRILIRYFVLLVLLSVHFTNEQFMTLRRLNIEIQGYPESYAAEPLDMVGTEVGQHHPPPRPPPPPPGNFHPGHPGVGSSEPGVGMPPHYSEHVSGPPPPPHHHTSAAGPPPSPPSSFGGPFSPTNSSSHHAAGPPSSLPSLTSMPSQPQPSGTSSYPPYHPPPQDPYSHSPTDHHALPTQELSMDPIEIQPVEQSLQLPSQHVDEGIAGDESAELPIKAESTIPPPIMDELNDSNNVGTQYSDEATSFLTPDESTPEIGEVDKAAVVAPPEDTSSLSDQIKTEGILEAESATSPVERETVDLTGDADTSLSKEEESSIGNTTTVKTEISTNTEPIESASDENIVDSGEVVTPLVDDSVKQDVLSADASTNTEDEASPSTSELSPSVPVAEEIAVDVAQSDNTKKREAEDSTPETESQNDDGSSKRRCLRSSGDDSLDD